MDLQLDLLTRVVNVHWKSGGVFSFVGNIYLNEVTLEGVGQSVPHFSWLGGTSSDGHTWKSNQSEAGLALWCCVGGMVGGQFVTIAAGGVVAGPYDFGPGYSIVYGEVPAAGVSYDGGETWSDAGIPKQQHILNPPNPITGSGADSAEGFCNAVAYHPGTQTFYVGGSVIFFEGSEIYWEDRMYSGTGSGFSQVYSERRELFDPFPGYQWPEVDTDMNPTRRLCVADMTETTEPGPGILFVVSFGSNQPAEYRTKAGETSHVSVNSDRTGVKLGENNIAPPMAVVNAVCGGGGHIVAVGWQDEDELTGPVTFVSDDEGVTWTEELSEHSHTNPGPDDTNSGSSSGSCSFSTKSSGSS